MLLGEKGEEGAGTLCSVAAGAEPGVQIHPAEILVGEEPLPRAGKKSIGTAQ